MKLKFFFVRSLSTLLMLMLTLVSIVLALAMLFVSAGRSPEINGLNIPFLLFGDELIPLMLFIPALIFRNRICASAAVLVSFFNIFLRLTAIIIFKESSMPLDYSALRLLIDHTNADALQALLGRGFMWWLAPLLVIIAAITGYCSFLTWKTADKSSRQLSRKSLQIFSFLLCLSVLSNLFYFFIKSNMPSNFIVLRPLPLAFYNITRDTISDIYHHNNYSPVALPEKSRQILIAMKILSPAPTVPEIKKQELPQKFDRIIIIATESLDYQFIAAHNPAMPSGITPNLDRLTKKYPSMKNYFCAAQPTSWGLNALITSRFDYHRDKYIHVESIFKLAKLAGFYTCYFSSAPGRLDSNTEIYKRLFGADHQMFLENWQKKYNYPRENYWGLSDTTLFNGVLQELKKINNPRFLTVISTIDTHEPYHNANLSFLEKEQYQTDFLRALHNTDRAIGLFVSAIMEDKKLYNDRTLIIITADHTATFGENYLKRPDFTPERIPLILITPQTGVFDKLDLEKYASSIDLPPTLMNLIGSTVPESFMGRDLFSDKDCAITWTVNRMISVHSKDGSFSVNMRDTPQDDTKIAIQDFYRAFYGQ
ncbi:MAG: hypothetical protein E7057_05965 [Lentisphaerae bacterium]|nr:hypothetical protein [Lentisphaerota bacterium]